jgi:YVTN family beta-propeller protein
MPDRFLKGSCIAIILPVSVLFVPHCGLAQPNTGAPQMVSTGQLITPLAPTGAQFQLLNPSLADNPGYTVGQAVTSALSPDGKTLLILTSGYNLVNYTSGANAGENNPTDSTEFVFVFDVSTGVAVQKQAIPLPATFSGIAFNPSGQQFYVAGGWNDEVHIFGVANGAWSEVETPVALGHLANKTTFTYGGLGLFTYPMAAGLAVTQDGATIVVCDYENDSISVLTGGGTSWVKSGELDLRPGVISPSTASGVPGGEFPYWVSIKGNATAYVSSARDREIDVVNIAGTPAVLARIAVPGNPNRSVLSADQSLLYVAQDNSDSVAVIDTGTNTVIDEIKVTAPAAVFPNRGNLNGANPNSVALSPDGSTLYVTDGGLNAVAVVSLSGTRTVEGLIPTGFYPNSLSVSADGKQLYIVNGKSATGANPLACDQTQATNAGTGQNCGAANQNPWQLTKAGFQTVPTPAASDLPALTAQVMQNDHLGNIEQFVAGGFAASVSWPGKPAFDRDRTMAELHRRIQHIIYIIKENRTYDQVLGDLEVGNGDPSITQFPQATTPNQHAIAGSFVDFDNFYDVSDVSGDGWPWSTSARTTDNLEKEIPVFYGNRGGDANSEGLNRNVNVGIANQATREAADTLIGSDPNLLPGTADVAAPDSDEGGAGEGYIWNAANKAGLTVRDYGFFLDLVRYTAGLALDPNPYADNLQVAWSTNVFLGPLTDIYYRGFDLHFPDYYRFTEWNREFQQFDAGNNLPDFCLVRFGNDHTGGFSAAIDGVNTPELQVADNDYAVGLLVDRIAHSKNYSRNTLIFVIEDDAQDGGDHVNAHRSTAYIVGPYVKHGFVDSTFYNTVSMLRTMEDILGMPHLNLNDAAAEPMADAFDLEQRTWTYSAVPSAYLASTTLPIPASAFDPAALKNRPRPLHGAAWWAARTRGMDFDEEDRLDAAKYNHLLWTGTMGNKPYPKTRSGLDLRANRAKWKQSRPKQQGPKTQGTIQSSSQTKKDGAPQASN